MCSALGLRLSVEVSAADTKSAILKLAFIEVISLPSFRQNILSAFVKVQLRERGSPSVTFKSAGSSVNSARTGWITVVCVAVEER